MCLEVDVNTNIFPTHYIFSFKAERTDFLANTNIKFNYNDVHKQ